MRLVFLVRKMHYKDPEVQKAYMKAYWEANREKKKEYNKAYRQTPEGKKSRIIGLWKHNGLIHEDYDSLYENYINTTSCQVCMAVFRDSSDRCMDHDHDTGLFRQFLCQDCNRHDSWKQKIRTE